MISRRTLLGAVAASGLIAPRAPAAAMARPWSDVERCGRGQTVFFNAWDGDGRTNALIAWANERMRMLHDVTVRHVRLSDTADAVRRVSAEKAAGRASDGSVDMIWLNGPNFLTMKRQGLLLGPVLDRLPNAGLINRAGKPETLVDFTEPTDGLGVPWRMAQVVFVHDTARLAAPPRTVAAMLGWAATHPGRLTHPRAADLMDATFLMQALIELAPDPAILRREASAAGYAAATAPLWAWYDALRPHLWHGGADFPASGPAQAALLAAAEIDLFISSNPTEAATGIARGALPPSVRAYVLDGGTLTSCSFVAIPFNAGHADAALLLADFLLSPEAQAQAANPDHLGAPSVLAVDRLPPADRARFDALPHPPGLLTAAELGHTLPEPHASWMTPVAAEWERRVTRQARSRR